MSESKGEGRASSIDAVSGLAARLRAHVQDRGGLSRDADTGEIVLPNGAWSMMLAAADALEAQARELAEERAKHSLTIAAFDARTADLATAQSRIAALEDAVRVKDEALVKAAIPLEAIRMAASHKLHSAEVEQAVDEAVIAIRTALSNGEPHD